MKYLILISTNPESQAMWESFSDAERAEGYAAYATLADDLASTGELVITEALADASQTKRVTVHDGKVLASDGPFAEVKEHLAGFFLVECDSMERAVEIAARIPAAEHMELEVRPVLNMAASEL
jgi:hypothetical protein